MEPRQQRDFPNLSKMALDILSIPAMVMMMMMMMMIIFVLWDLPKGIRTC
jgi:hypothetical protein